MAFTVWYERLFQVSTILLEKECFLKVDLQWFLYNFRLWPRVVELFKVKNLLSFELLNNVKTWIISPLNLMVVLCVLISLHMINLLLLVLVLLLSSGLFQSLWIV